MEYYPYGLWCDKYSCWCDDVVEITEGYNKCNGTCEICIHCKDISERK